MIREDFLIKFNAGEYPNIFPAVSIPNGKNRESSGLTTLAVVTSWAVPAEIVDVFGPVISVEDSQRLPPYRFVWLDKAWANISSVDPPKWVPALFRFKTRFDPSFNPDSREVAKKYLAIAASLDPEIEILPSALDEVEEGPDMVASMEGLNVPERLRRMADLLEAGLSEAKSAVNEFLEGGQS